MLPEVMGTRVEFYIGAEDGLETILLNQMQNFRKWFEKATAEWPSDYEVEALATAVSVLEEGPVALKANDKRTAIQVDKLVDAFIGDFCDHGDGQHLLKGAPSGVINVGNYYECLQYLEKDTWPEVFWNFILHGRPVARDPKMFPYRSSDGVFSVSFATAKEVESLRLAFAAMSFPGKSLHSGLNDASLALKITQEALDYAYNERLGLIITTA